MGKGAGSVRSRGIPYYGTPREVAENFINSLETHVMFVKEAGEMIGVPSNLLEAHDMSKWSEEEFPHYARHFYGDKGDPKGFTRAWLHHIHYNPHHWQYWRLSDDYSPPGADVDDGCIEMPERYVREMVADWMGASRAYTSSWDMSDWLRKNLCKVRVHRSTEKLLWNILIDIGYRDIAAPWREQRLLERGIRNTESKDGSEYDHKGE